VSEDQVLRLERRIAASPERVFEHFTEPELLVKWWGPEGYDTPGQSLDVRPGGQWETTMREADGSRHTVSGIYRVIDKPRRLVFTWGWHDDTTGVRGHETEVTLTFEAAPGGTTKLTLVQQPFETGTGRDMHTAGWVSSFDCLDKALA
jgi:uncharacterized protein YndB with AHSA1/START domain